LEYIGIFFVHDEFCTEMRLPEARCADVVCVAMGHDDDCYAVRLKACLPNICDRIIEAVPDPQSMRTGSPASIK